MLPTYVRDDAFTGVSKKVAGSREHFFHFLIGYLLPIVHAQRRYQHGTFLVLDCGPLMTPILRETLNRLNFSFQIVPPHAIKTPVYVEPWDHPQHEGWDSISTRALRSAADLVSAAWRAHTCEQPVCPRSANLLLQRSAAHEYYVSGPAEIKGYGLSRRGVTNWSEVQMVLKDRGIDHAVYEPGRHSLGCQIAAFQQARRIVGMRGAEWANTVWCHAGARARILDPAPPATLLTDLLHRLDVHHEFAVVNETLARADPGEVASFLTTP